MLISWEYISSTKCYYSDISYQNGTFPLWTVITLINCWSGKLPNCHSNFNALCRLRLQQSYSLRDESQLTPISIDLNNTVNRLIFSIIKLSNSHWNTYSNIRKINKLWFWINNIWVQVGKNFKNIGKFTKMAYVTTMWRVKITVIKNSKNIYLSLNYGFAIN